METKRSISTWISMCSRFLGKMWQCKWDGNISVYSVNLHTPVKWCLTSPWEVPIIGVGVGVSHTTISLICMSTHKAIAARCLSYHQAASGQPAIRALATAPLRRLALSVLFTIVTTSYQTTCTVSERSSIKDTCQCKPTQCRLLALRQWGYSKLLRS